VAVERSPSSVLLVLHAERSAVLACVRAPPADCPDEPDPAAEAPDPLRSDAVPLPRYASGAWAGARPDVRAGAVHPRLRLADEDAGRSAAPEQDAQARGASFPQLHWLAAWARVDAAAELYIRAAVQSGEQSFAA
jgi:hypothetical protein